MRFYRITPVLLVLATLAISAPGFGQDQTRQQGTQQGTMGPGMMGGQSMGPGQGMGPGGLMMMGMMSGCPMMGMMAQQGGPEAMVEGRLGYLKDEIGIKRSQTKTWGAFAEAMRANAQSMAEMRGQMMAQMGQGVPSATQMLDTHMAMMESRLEAMKTLKPAMDALYKDLSSKQRKRADALMPGVGCMM